MEATTINHWRETISTAPELHRQLHGPPELNKLVLDAIIQQASVEGEVQVHESFPSEKRGHPSLAGNFAKRTRRRKAAVVNTPAPPVYLRPQAPPLLAVDEQAPMDFDENAPPFDDADFRAQQAATLGPILNQSEGERRRKWLQVDPELKKLLRNLRVNFGHPTTVTLQRILRRQGAKPEVITAAGLMACDACGESMRQKRAKPVRLPSSYQFNNHILADTFYAKDSAGRSLAFLNIICDATSFQVVSCLGETDRTTCLRSCASTLPDDVDFLGWTSTLNSSGPGERIHGSVLRLLEGVWS